MKEKYILIGQAIEIIQKWEALLKEVTIHFHISESDDKRSLNNMALFLFRKNALNENNYLLIKKAIENRNYLIHRSFIDQSSSFDEEKIKFYLEPFIITKEVLSALLKG